MHKKGIYTDMVYDYWPLKSEQYRVRFTVGGDMLDNESDVALLVVSLLETKLLINSVISQSVKRFQFMILDIKDCFLQTSMQECEYTRIHEKCILYDVQ